MVRTNIATVGEFETSSQMIAKSWTPATLGECLEKKPDYGINAPACPYMDSLPKYIRITDISSDGKFSPSPPTSVNHPLSQLYLLNDGDVVVARTGASTGKSYLYRKSDGPLVFAGFLIRLRPNRSKIDSRYLSYSLQTTDFWKWIRVMSMRSGQPGINGVEYAQLPLMLPDIEEQESIADALSDTDALISSFDKLVEKKRYIKQGVMQELLTGKRRLPGFSGKWKLVKFGELGGFYSGGTPNTKEASFYGGDIPWITSSDLNDVRIQSVSGRITKIGLESSSAQMVKAGTLLIAMYGATAGVCAITEINAAINQAVLAVIFNNSNTEFFLQRLILSKDWIIKTYTQGGQPNLSGQIIKSIELQIPDRKEQDEIAVVLREMDREIEILEMQLKKLQQVKQGMMQNLLTGKIRLI